MLGILSGTQELRKNAGLVPEFMSSRFETCWVGVGGGSEAGDGNYELVITNYEFLELQSLANARPSRGTRGGPLRPTISHP